MLPAIALLREAQPGAEITWVINPELAPLLRGNPDVNHVHLLPSGRLRGLGAAQSLLPWLKKTQAIRPDLALDFQGLRRSALVARISGAKEVCGMSDARVGANWLYDRVARVNRRSHPVERYLKLAEYVSGAAASHFDARFQVAIRFRASTRIRRSFFFIRSRAGRTNRFQTESSRNSVTRSRQLACWL